jgi:hypothetical protein
LCLLFFLQKCFSRSKLRVIIRQNPMKGTMEATKKPESSAVTFAYERFGRHVVPDRPEDWLRKPAAQRKSMGLGNAMIIISESGVQFLGSADYTAFGFPPPIRDSDLRSRIMDRLLFWPARERWLAVRFTRAAVPASMLHLNTPGSAVNAYYDGEAKGLVVVRHADVRAIGEALLERDVRSTRAVEMLSLARDVIADLIDPSSKERRKYEAALGRVPELPALAERAINADLDFNHIRRYMAILEGV